MSLSRLGLSEHGNGLFQASAFSVMLIRLSFIHLLQILFCSLWLLRHYPSQQELCSSTRIKAFKLILKHSVKKDDCIYTVYWKYVGFASLPSLDCSFWGWYALVQESEFILNPHLPIYTHGFLVMIKSDKWYSKYSVSLS